MDPNENQAICAFDTLYTNNHIQILKVLLPYFDRDRQKRLAVLIKFMELRYTMEYFGRQMTGKSAFADAQMAREELQQPDIVGIFEQIKSFCTPSERAMFDQLANMKKSMEMYEEMMGMMQLFSQLMPGEDTAIPDATSPVRENIPEPESGSPAQNNALFGSANPMDMLKGMLSPEQQTMFELFASSLGNHGPGGGTAVTE